MLKHAHGARKVELLLEFASHSLSLKIADDGAGCPAKVAQGVGSENAGIGLRGMRQRMDGIGGTFDIGPRPGAGTVVTATVALACKLQSDATS